MKPDRGMLPVAKQELRDFWALRTMLVIDFQADPKTVMSERKNAYLILGLLMWALHESAKKTLVHLVFDTTLL